MNINVQIRGYGDQLRRIGAGQSSLADQIRPLTGAVSRAALR